VETGNINEGVEDFKPVESIVEGDGTEGKESLDTMKEIVIEDFKPVSVLDTETLDKLVKFLNIDLNKLY
jgi:hypothetical protein